MQHFYALILAGGGGTRLWPMSRRETPKQLLRLLSDETMFQTSIKRLAPLFQPEQIFIATGPAYVNAYRQDAPQIPAENMIVEPYARDNAAATALAMTTIHERDPEAVVAMLTVDHFIGKTGVFLKVLEAAHEIAQHGAIVTLGIAPTYPATGYGYIQQGRKMGDLAGFSYYEALRFTEKPDEVKATRFVASGHYSWNSGMFIWKAARALAEFERQQPAMSALFERLRPTMGTSAYESTLAEIWPQTPKLSIDYAVMEDAAQMVVIPVDIGWNDVGSWSSLFEVLPNDKFGNVARGTSEDDRVMLDTERTLLYTDKLTVTIGVEDLIVVETEDVLFLCHRDRAQDVRQIVKYLGDNDRSEYL